MAKVKSLELKLGKISPMEVAASIIESTVETTEDALKARVILQEALADFAELINSADKKLDTHITPDKLAALDEKVIVEIAERIRYTFTKGTTKQVALDPKYKTNQELHAAHPELVDRKETVIYALKKDAEESIDDAVLVTKSEYVKQSKRKISK